MDLSLIQKSTMHSKTPLVELRTCATLLLTRALSDFRHDIAGMRAWAASAMTLIETLKARCPGARVNFAAPPQDTDPFAAWKAWQSAAVSALRTLRHEAERVHSEAVAAGAKYDTH